MENLVATLQKTVGLMKSPGVHDASPLAEVSLRVGRIQARHFFERRFARTSAGGRFLEAVDQHRGNAAESASWQIPEGIGATHTGCHMIGMLLRIDLLSDSPKISRNLSGSMF
jgi:hypothetical protein